MADRAPLIDRLHARLREDDNGCWIWMGTRRRSGYALKVSRGPGEGMIWPRCAMYELYRAEIPEGLVIDHLCRNPPCCNPWHLEPVTQRENTMRADSPPAINARKTHCPQGHPYDEKNTHHHPAGDRRCRRCAAEYATAKRAVARQLRTPTDEGDPR